ncbi:MAG: hypothetical protein HY755_12235 [Nitrospirae bacterium]|nr:hypothetical protein [Nitrospirota bacterium]
MSTNKDTDIVEGKDIELVEAAFVNIKQSSIRAVEGGHIELQQVGALSIDGERVESTQCAAGILKGNDVSLNQSISAVTVGDNTTLNFSFSPMVISKKDTIANKSAIGLMAGIKIKAENSASIMMIANKVEGNITTLLDWRGAVALGAVFGGILGIISLFRRR